MHEEPKWKWPLIIAIIALSILVPLGIQAYKIDRGQKIEAHLNNAKEVKNLLCDDQGTELRSEFQQKWTDAYSKPDIVLSVISPLRMEEVDAYYDKQCSLAKEYLQLAKGANTDNEKLASYKQVRQLRDETADQVELLLEEQLESAKTCADAYLLAEQAEAQAGRTDPYAEQARGYIAVGSWGFCEFYSQQSVIVSQQVTACNNNLAIATNMESVLGTHPYADQAREYQSQQSWSFCAFYAAQAVYDMEAQMPTETPPP